MLGALVCIPRWCSDKLPASLGDTRDAGSIPGWGRSPGVGNGNPLQYSCLEHPMDRGAWRATLHESDVTKRTRTHCVVIDLQDCLFVYVCFISVFPSER